jgi:hypothetical protein
MTMLGGNPVYQFPDLASTCLIPGTDGDIHLRYHETNVVTFHPDNTFTLNTGGYETRTTKARINQFGPVKVYSREGTWFLDAPEGPVEFADGIRVDSFGEPVDDSAEFSQYPTDEYAVEVTIDNQIGKMYL